MQHLQHDSTSTSLTRTVREHTSTPSPGNSSVSAIGVMSLVDVEMTHFFSTKTYKTISFRREGQLLWRDVIFESSLTQPALLQGILTTAMLHKVTISDSPQTKQKYTEPALKKQGDALKSFIMILNEPSPSNCEALFCLSMLLTIWAFASRRLPPELNILYQSVFDQVPNALDAQGSRWPSSIDDYVKIVGISQGVYAVIKETLDWLEDRPVSEFMRRCDTDTLPTVNADVDKALTELEDYLGGNQQASDPGSPGLSLEELELFGDQIQKLRLTFRFGQRPEWHDKVIGWPIMLPSPFAQAMKQRNPAALTILAYWAACLYALDDLWWIHGWPKALVIDICSIVQGPWKQFLKWPRQVFRET